MLEGQSSLIGSLLGTDGALADLINSFVPTIRNSTTSCVPCGGAVRADAPSDATYQRGCAGGYCGHNNGGNIWGNNNATWMDQNDRLVAGFDFGHDREGHYIGEKHECAAYRIRSVYGYEYAGGFTGFMESANLADAGSVSLLKGLLGNREILSVTNLLGALKMVYPTEENTAVYGPLRNLDVETWNNWVNYVGKYHGYGLTLAKEGKVEDQSKLNDIIEKYIYGYHAVAGRSTHALPLASEGGDAGGYIGLMYSGKITNGRAYDAKLVQSFRNTGGYAGSMQTGGAAELGGANLLGMNLDLGQLVTALKVFVPAICSGTVEGYQSGMTVTCTGNDFSNHCGYAGGYVGSAYGAQIWGNKKYGDSDGTGCDVKNLRYVKGNNAAGGYAGLTKAASVADVNTNASKGLLQGLLNTIISNAGSLASVIEATITTVYRAQVSADNTSFGFSVDGYNGAHPKYAGGFAGVLEATWAGDKEYVGDSNRVSDLIVNNLRSVDGRFDAGGFFGFADVNGAVEVSGGEESSILNGALSVGEVSLIDVFRPKVYFSEVSGVADGFTVKAYESDSQATLGETRYSGCAGGFGGAMMNGVVNDSKVTALSTVSGLNYTGGFIGHMGKSTYANSESLVPNPGETKDPCGNINLTIQKVWNDDNNKDQSRPDSIKVRIWQHWVREDGTPVMDGSDEKKVLYIDSAVIPDVDQTDGWFEINNSRDGRAGSATWTRVIKDLPAAVEDEETHVYTYFTYTVEEAPVLGYSSEITHNENDSTPIATITNAPKDFVIEFKYYDRYHDYMTAAGIDDKPTTYSVTLKGIPQKFIENGFINYSRLIGDTAVEFSKNALAVNNLICDYDLWTSQQAAVNALNGENYFYFDGANNGAHVSYNNQTCHTDYLGKPQTSDTEKWVTYFDSDTEEVTEEKANGTANAAVSKIVVWCYNYPKQYITDIYGADEIKDVTEKTVGERTIYVADSIKTDNRRAGSDTAKFYYNQRFGGATGDWNADHVTGKDNAGFIEKYGLKAYTNVMPANYTAESFNADDKKYNFAYWAYDQEGTQIASVERSFGYRVTTNTKLYAVYATEGSAPGISISADANDTYVDGNGISRTRLNIFGSVYGAPDYDKNVLKLSFVNISLSTQIRDNPEVYTPEKITALFEQYKSQLKEIIEHYDATSGSHPFSVAQTYDGDFNAENKIDQNLHLTLTTKGFIYTVISNGNEAEQNDVTMELTNKNRGKFTANYKTSALNINNTGTNGNSCLMFCGALKYKYANKPDGEWSISTNCLIYYNGKVVDNTASKWQ